MRKDNLLSFIGGAAFVAFALPVITETVALIETLGECVRTKITCIYYDDAKRLQASVEPEEPENTFAIGFQADPVEYDEDDDE